MNRRFTFFISSLLLLSCFIFFITCKKEYSYEGGGSPTPPPPPPPPPTVGNASFTLTGTPNNCYNAYVKGTYVSGVRLSNANTVDINVNVTVIGNYSITTDTINGVWFSRSGTFTNTGNQIITLDGNGTPELARNLIFTPLAGSSSCTFKISVANPEPLAVYVLESAFGNPNPCIETISGTYNSNTPLSGSNTVSIRVYVVYLGNFTIATSTVNGMTFSYTGRFTTIGAQDVILYGSGTPVTRGNYTFTPEIVGPHPLGGEVCAFFIQVN
jgi:hypothetical protein